MTERPSTDIVKAVIGGLVDIGVVSDAAPTEPLETRPFVIDRLVVILAREHPLALCSRLTMADLTDESHIGFSGALQRYLKEQADRLGLRLRYRVHLSSFEGVCRAVAADGGIGIVPELAARQFSPQKLIRIVRLRDSWATRRLLLCRRAGENLEAAA